MFATLDTYYSFEHNRIKKENFRDLDFDLERDIMILFITLYHPMKQNLFVLIRYFLLKDSSSNHNHACL